MRTPRRPKIYHRQFFLNHALELLIRDFQLFDSKYNLKKIVENMRLLFMETSYNENFKTDARISASILAGNSLPLQLGRVRKTSILLEGI